MFETIYGLNLASVGAGTYVKAPVGGAESWSDLTPLGATYTDVFRRSRAPQPRELVQQLVGTAYACATLNADMVAATPLRLYLRTRPGEPAAKEYLRPARPAESR